MLLRVRSILRRPLAPPVGDEQPHLSCVDYRRHFLGQEVSNSGKLRVHSAQLCRGELGGLVNSDY